MKINYSPAQLREGKRWYITYYQTDPLSKKKVRIKRTYGLNLIKDLDTRRDQGIRIVQKINAQLPFGYPFVKEKAALDYTILEGFKVGLQQKMMNPKKATTNSYRSHGKFFIKWLIDNGLDNINLIDFNKRHAMLYLNSIITNSVIRNSTYNNKVQALKAIFYELVDQEIIDRNPFSKIKKKKTGKKLRRAFTPNEIKIISPYIYSDKELFLATLLIYHCMIRPAELRRLRGSCFRLNQGVIIIPADDTKNAEKAVITIPDIILPYLNNWGFDKIPDTYYIWGPKLKPHPSVQCGKNAMYNQHRDYLVKLLNLGKLISLEGLTLYSWKDSGDRDLINADVNILSVRDHNRHKSIETTNAYLERRITRDPQIAKLSFTIIPEKRRDSNNGASSS